MDTDIRSAREQTAELRSAESEALLRDTIESIAEGFAVFDTDDRLVSCNKSYRSLFEDASEYIVPGVSYAEILREGLARGHYADALGREEKWLAQRLEEQREPRAASEHRLSDGRWVLVTKRRMTNGWTSSVRVDITGLKAAQEEATQTRQKLVEQQLGAERQFRLVVEATPNGMIMVDAAGRVAMLNSQAERMFGHTRSELVGKPVEVLVPERFRATHPAMRATFLAEPASRPMGVGRDLFGLRKDGTEFPVEIGFNPINIGERTMVLASVVDISERHKAEAELREGESRFRVMADTAPVMIWMSGTDKLCTWFNKPWLDFVGRSMDQEIGDGWAENIHPEDYDRCLETYVTAFDARQPFLMEYRLRHHDGEHRWVLDNGVPRYGGAGEFAGYIGSCIDITERKAAEMALRESEHQARSLAAIVASSDDAIIGTTLDGIVTSWNRAAERVFGYSTGEMVGQSVLRLAPPGREREMIAILERIKRGEKVDHYETQRRCKDGALLDVSLSESPIYNIHGQLIGVSKVARDITESKRAATALRESESRLLELHAELQNVSRLSAMGQMAATLAHELNQPLTAISNYMGALKVLLDRRSAPPDQLRAIIERAEEQAVRAGQIIQRQREFMSRGDTEKRIEFLPPLLEEARELALLGTQQRGVPIRLEDDIPRLSLIVDKIQLQQVLLNLLRNAIEAVSGQHDGNIVLSGAEHDDETVEISVADNGPGLPEEIRAKLFQPFVSTKKTGMGVGLSISHAIITAHNGRLWAESNSGGGTVFRMTLPGVPVEEASDG
jgi:two-component system, LuxR family, sensor kinase FixL